MDAVLASAYKLAGRPAGMIQRIVTQMCKLVNDLMAELEDYAVYACPPMDPESMVTYQKVIAPHTYQIDFCVKSVEKMIVNLEEAERGLAKLLAF